MPTRPVKFTRIEIARAIRGARDANLAIDHVEIVRGTGDIRICTSPLAGEREATIVEPVPVK